jgi:hypothetical protein
VFRFPTKKNLVHSIIRCRRRRAFETAQRQVLCDSVDADVAERRARHRRRFESTDIDFWIVFPRCSRCALLTLDFLFFVVVVVVVDL